MVMSPDEGSRSFGRSATFCLTIWRGEGTDTMAQRRQPLLDAGCVNVIDFGALFWKHADTLLPHYSLDLPQKVLAAAAAVRAGFELWSDDASRAEYVAQVRWRLWLDFDNLPPPVNQEIYFPADLMTMSEDEVFIDCGAYDGDTAANFIRHTGGHFKAIYAFEADQQNFEKLCVFVSGLPSHLQRSATMRGFCGLPKRGRRRRPCRPAEPKPVESRSEASPWTMQWMRCPPGSKWTSRDRNPPPCVERDAPSLLTLRCCRSVRITPSVMYGAFPCKSANCMKGIGCTLDPSFRSRGTSSVMPFPQGDLCHEPLADFGGHTLLQRRG
jgi:hypothetical protein